MSNWNWLRFTMLLSGVGAGVASFLVPPLAPVLLPAATGLIGATLGHGLTAPKDAS